jgi:MSHA pilin protein MshC
MRRAKATRGFTLVEVCSVLVIAGILMAFAGPKLLETAAFNQRGYTDELAAVIRTSESAATASGCDVQLTITPGTGYDAKLPAAGATCSGAFSVPVPRADGSPLAATPPPDADVSAPITLTFGSQGSVVSPTPIGNSITISVDASPPGGAQPQKLTLYWRSGLVTMP